MILIFGLLDRVFIIVGILRLKFGVLLSGILIIEMLLICVEMVYMLYVGGYVKI